MHRDIKPANLLLDVRGNVWVTDFGVAKLNDQHTLTNTGDVVGTVRYLAPEMFDGKADARSEVYALGLTLYELLAFRPAFVETDRSRLMRQILTGAPGRLEKFNSEIPRDLATIVHKAIDRDPRCRYQTAREFADDLQRFLADGPSGLVVRGWRNGSFAGRAGTRAWRPRLQPSPRCSSPAPSLPASRQSTSAGWPERPPTGAIRRNRRSTESAGSGTFQHRRGRERPATPEHWPGPHRTGRGAERIPQLGVAASAQPTRRPRLIVPVPLTFTWSESRRFVASPVGSEVAVAFAIDHQVRVWDTTTGAERVRWSGPEAPRYVYVYSPDGKRLATGSEHHAIRVWDVATGKLLTKLVGHQGPVWAVAFNPDGRRIASSSEDRTFRLWDATTGQSLALLGSNEGEPTVPALFSPDGKWIATGRGKKSVSGTE